MDSNEAVSEFLLSFLQNLKILIIFSTSTNLLIFNHFIFIKIKKHNLIFLNKQNLLNPYFIKRNKNE
jgi:hypothetical protein